MATTGSLIEWLASGVITTAGVQVASGVVRFYQPGTLTPQTVYSDSAAASPITPPLVLSAGGVATVYATQPVRMIVKDASDTNTLFDVTENVRRAEQTYVTSTSFNSGTETQLSTILDGWTTSAGGSAGIFKYKRSTNATERNLKDAIGEARISVKDRNAAGDGITDDTTATAAAITEISSNGGGTVFFPPGTFLITAALVVPANVSLIGAGSAVSIIKQGTAATNGVTISAAGTGNNTIQGLQITHSTTSTGIGISCVSTNKIILRDVLIATSKFATGVKFDACNNTAIYDSYIFGRDTGAHTGRAISYTTSGSGHIVVGGQVGADATGKCIELDTGTSGFTLFAINFLQGAVGVRLTSSDNDDLIRVIGCLGLDSNIGTPFEEGGALGSQSLYQIGNFVDGVSVNVLSGGTVTPSPLINGRKLRVRATTTGVVYTIAAPTTNPIQDGFQLSMQLFNNAAGAVTGWTLNAIYRISAAISTTDLNKTNILFEWDANASVFQEVGRAVTT